MFYFSLCLFEWQRITKSTNLSDHLFLLSYTVHGTMSVRLLMFFYSTFTNFFLKFLSCLMFLTATCTYNAVQYILCSVDFVVYIYCKLIAVLLCNIVPS